MPEKDRHLIEQIKDQIQKRKHRKYGYRRICEILCRIGPLVNHKRIYRLWHNEGLHLKHKEKRGKRKNTGAGQNACDRRPAEYMDHIWSYDFIEEKLQNRRKVRVLNIVDWDFPYNIVYFSPTTPLSLFSNRISHFYQQFKVSNLILKLFQQEHM